MSSGKTSKSSAPAVKATTPKVARPKLTLGRIINTILFDLPINIKIMKANELIFLIRILTLPLYISMMIYFNDFSTAAYLTLALHCSYSILWIAKTMVWPSPSLEKLIGLGSLPFAAAYYSLYWALGYIMFSGLGTHGLHGERIFVCCFLVIIGSVLSLSADIQKSIMTQYGGGGLITTGFFKLTRNPNYLGEFLISFGLAFAAGHYYAWYIVAAMWCLVFWPKMWEKDNSLKEKNDWSTYRDNTYLFLPKVFPADIANYTFYGTILLIIFTFNSRGGITGFLSALKRTSNFQRYLILDLLRHWQMGELILKKGLIQGIWCYFVCFYICFDSIKVIYPFNKFENDHQ